MSFVGDAPCTCIPTLVGWLAFEADALCVDSTSGKTRKGEQKREIRGERGGEQ